MCLKVEYEPSLWLCVCMFFSLPLVHTMIFSNLEVRLLHLSKIYSHGKISKKCPRMLFDIFNQLYTFVNPAGRAILFGQTTQRGRCPVGTQGGILVCLSVLRFFRLSIIHPSVRLFVPPSVHPPRRPLGGLRATQRTSDSLKSA